MNTEKAPPDVWQKCAGAPRKRTGGGWRRLEECAVNEKENEREKNTWKTLSSICLNRESIIYLANTLKSFASSVFVDVVLFSILVVEYAHIYVDVDVVRLRIGVCVVRCCVDIFVFCLVCSLIRFSNSKAIPHFNTVRHILYWCVLFPIRAHIHAHASVSFSLSHPCTHTQFGGDSILEKHFDSEIHSNTIWYLCSNSLRIWQREGKRREKKSLEHT